MKKKDIISYIKEKSVYSVVADNYTTMDKMDMVDVTKELDYAVANAVTEEKYQEIISSLIDALIEEWSEELEEEGKEDIDIPMLKVSVDTGTMELNVFYVEGTQKDNVSSLIDEYVQEHKDDFAVYSLVEIEVFTDNDEDIASEEYFAINGGEYYIGRIVLVEETSSFEIKKILEENSKY